MDKLDLYGDNIPKPQKLDITIPIDLNKNQSLMELIERVNVHLNDNTDNNNITLYFVCGIEESKFNIKPFINWIKSTINQTNNVMIAYRGYLHTNEIQLLMQFDDIHIDSNCQFIYNSSRLHELLSILSDNKSILNNFIQLFITSYRNYPSIAIGIDGLISFGFNNIKKF